MAIVKSKQAGNFTILPNEIFKAKLSLESIGLLSYLLSLPPDWVLYKTTLHSHLGIGKHKLNTAFVELTTKGFIVSSKVINDYTKQISYNHLVFDKPQIVEPITEKSNTENPQPENPCTDNHIYNNIYNKETTTNTNLTKEELINSRKLAFSETLKPFLVKYGKEMLNDFYIYWTETNPKKTKLRFEMNKTWDVAGRLRTWDKNNFGKKTITTPNELLRDPTLGVLNL